MASAQKMTSRYLTLTDGKGLKGTFSTRGAGVQSLTLDGKPLILELADREAYLSANQFFGKTLGRVAGRIPADFAIGQKHYHVLGDDQGICLHGGILKSLSFRNFRALKKKDAIAFTYLSPDGECGFPGNLKVKVTYTMPKGKNTLTIRFEVTTDKATPVAFSNHIYWNVFNSKDVNDYKLQVLASKIGVFKKDCQLIAKTKKVSKAFDFRKLSSLKDKLDAIEKEVPEIGTLDHSLLLDKPDPKIPQVVMDTKDITLKVFTNFDAINLYVDSSLSPTVFTNRNDFERRRAIAIEPEAYMLDNLILKPKQKYDHFIRYQIIKK